MGKFTNCGKELHLIIKFVASLDPEIPNVLLGFYPRFCFWDMPVTSHRHAQECREAALDAGLTRVRVGNAHLLGRDY